MNLIYNQSKNILVPGSKRVNLGLLCIALCSNSILQTCKLIVSVPQGVLFTCLYTFASMQLAHQMKLLCLYLGYWGVAF